MPGMSVKGQICRDIHKIRKLRIRRIRDVRSVSFGSIGGDVGARTLNKDNASIFFLKQTIDT